MRRPFRACFLALACSLFAEPLLATVTPGAVPSLEPCVHQEWHAADGLPEEAVVALVRSTDGYLWIATQDGLARYDGHRFELFHPRNTPALKSRSIKALAAGQAGEVWVGCAQGLYHYRDGLFEPVRAGGLEAMGIRSLFRTRKGVLYVGTRTGLIRLDNGVAVALPAADGAPFAIGAMAESASGDLAVLTDKGLFDVVGSSLVPRQGPPGNPSLRSLLFDRKGNLWLAGRGGLWHEAPGGFQNLPILGSGSHKLVSRIFEDASGTLWVGTNQGLGRVLPGPMPQAVKVELAIGAAEAWSEDDEGGLWVGTWGHGLHRFRVGRASVIGMAEGLPSNFTLGIAQTRDGAMWVGTQEGLARLKGTQRQTWGMKEGLLDPHVQALFADEDGTVWVGTWSNVARVVGGRLQDVGLKGHYVFAIDSDGKGGLWLGTYKGLLHVEDRHAPRLVATPVANLGLGSVWMIHRARDGSLWLAGEKSGLTRVRGQEVKTFEPPAFPREPVVSALEEADGTLWFGTAGAGILRLKGDRFERITTAHGLPDDVVYALIPKGDGNLWGSSNHGIFRVGLKSMNAVADGRQRVLEEENIGLADGLRSIECNGTVSQAGLLAQDGRLWFPTTNGVAVIDPSLDAARFGAPVVIEEVLGDRKHLPANPTLHIPAGKGEVEFRFTAINFSDPVPTPLRYRLDGFDQDWRESIGEWRARYTNLPPGRYVFRVESFTEGPSGVIPGRQAAQVLVLAPHWYQRSGLMALLLGAALAALLVLNHYRVLRIKARSRARQAALQQAVDEALSHVKTLQGLVPVCAWCHNVRTDQGFWQKIEAYISERSDAKFSHGICPECRDKFKAGE